MLYSPTKPRARKVNETGGATESTDPNIRNVKIRRRPKNPDFPDDDDFGPQTVDSAFRGSAYQDNLLSRPGGLLGPDTRSNTGVNNSESGRSRLGIANPRQLANQAISQARLSSAAAIRNNSALRPKLAGPNLPSWSAVKEKEAKIQANLKRVQGAQVVLRNLTWSLPLWLVQLKFGLLQVISLSALAGIDQALSKEGGVVAYLAGTITQAANAILKVVGVDFPAIFQLLFFISWILIFAIGIITIMSLSTQFKIAGLHPFFGERSDLKQTFLILTLVIYAIPLLNLLPGFIFWLWAVWRYPN